ncbi:hypothetical protein ES702_04068 [subsurface metagenome]
MKTKIKWWLELPSDSPNIIEDDIIEVWGLGGGVETYTTAIGSENTVPRILGVYIELLVKAGSRQNIGIHKKAI